MTHHNHEHQKWHPAEELNGRLAMIGVVAALLNYAWTGQIIPARVAPPRDKITGADFRKLRSGRKKVKKK